MLEQVRDRTKQLMAGRPLAPARIEQQEPNWKYELLGLLVALLLPFAAGAAGAVATSQSVSTWYPTLRKPAWNPPGWVFGPVWSLLYVCMGLASWAVWRKRKTQKQQVQNALRWYGVQLGFNLLWSLIFFGLRRIRLAFVDILVLWGTLLATMTRFARVRPGAAWLLVPYFLWVSFAATLNAAIWWLNRDR